MSPGPEPSEALQPNPTRTDCSTSEHTASLAEVSALANSLDPKDRMRLIASLLESLSPRHRAAILAYGRQIVRPLDDEIDNSIKLTPIGPTVPTLWDRLFAPTDTSDLYSAPRRFDLATIFVVTAAYSLLFGLMTPLDFGPAMKVAVGLLVTIVATTQAFYHDKANPRGISVVTGAIALTVILVVLKVFVRNSIYGSLFVVVVFYGLIGGAIAGYLSGTLVGGVFLVADKLRTYFANRAGHSQESGSDNVHQSTEASESPWTN
jgi:hypothetical protein